MVNLYQYTNYREFINDALNEKKRSGSRVSMRALSKRAGFGSPNSFRMILMGERNLTTDSAGKMAKILGLAEREADFFKHLVSFNQSSDPKKKSESFRKLCYFKAFQEIKKIDHASYVYFSQWYFPTVREMSYFPDFKGSPEWIMDRLGGAISVDQAEKAIQLLLKMGLLVESGGKLKPNKAVVLSSDNDVASVSLWAFHQQMIGKASQAIQKENGQHQDISSLTIAIDEETFHAARKKIEKFKQDMAVFLSRSKTPDAVYQLNMQFFALSDIATAWSPAKRKKVL